MPTQEVLVMHHSGRHKIRALALTSLLLILSVTACLSSPPPAVLEAPTSAGIQLPDQWTPTPSRQPSPSPRPPDASPTQAPASATATQAPSQLDRAAIIATLDSTYPQVDATDLYLRPNKYIDVRFRLTSTVVRTGFHESFYPGTPEPVSVFIVQLDPHVGGNSFQYPFLVVGIPSTEVLTPGVTITVYGYGLGAAQGENAAGGISSSSAIFAEGYIVGS